jgi:pimeloyl-ACP methyl ester carboxylesterase
VTLDNRGTGRTSAPEGNYSIKTVGDDVAGLLDRLEMPRAHVLGESMGGMIAQELAINHPKKVKGLILACTTPGGSVYDAIPGQREASEKLRWMFAPPPSIPPEALLEDFMKVFCTQEFFDQHKARMMTFFMPKYPTSRSTLEKQYDAMVKFDTYNRLETISSRTLVIHGEDDRGIMPENARILARQIPNAKLKIFKQARHAVLEEKWQEVKPAILDFLKRCDTC